MAVGGAVGEPAQSVGCTDGVDSGLVITPEVTFPVVGIEPKHGGRAPPEVEVVGCVDGGGGGIDSVVAGADSVDAGVDTVGEVTFVARARPIAPARSTAWSKVSTAAAPSWATASASLASS